MSKTKNTTLSIANKTNTAPTNGRPVSAMMQSQPKGDIATQPITGAMPAVGGDDAATKNQRPDFLPEKFWDEEHQQVRLAELSKSYSALEKQFGKNRSDLQKLEKLQAEKNTLEENQARLQADLETATLFGKIGRGTGGWQEERESLAAFGRHFLGAAMTSEMLKNEQGVRALQFIRQGLAEPHLLNTSGGHKPTDERALRRLMQSPDYWRARKTDLLKKVEDGFDRLYGDKK